MTTSDLIISDSTDTIFSPQYWRVYYINLIRINNKTPTKQLTFQQLMMKHFGEKAKFE